MSRLMLLFGVLFLALGLVLALLIQFQPGQMQVLALTPEVAALFFVGGALCWGLGDVAAAMREMRGTGSVVADAPAADEEAEAIQPEPPATPKFKGFGARTAATAAAAAGADAPVSHAAIAARTSVADTIADLEQAKSDIAAALGVEPQSVRHTSPLREPTPEIMTPPAFTKPEPEPEPHVEEAAHEAAPAPDVDAEPADEPDLYVVEEKVIRGRPARILSDGTVEAETDEGWMRFENLEHLDEYIDAMVPDA